jgi:AraC-like DNA-binding protein
MPSAQPAEGGRQGARVTFFRPARALRDAIESYFIFEISRPVRDLLPPGWMHSGWIVEGAWQSGPVGGDLRPVPPVTLSGPYERAVIAQGTPSRVIALTMTPLGWTQLVGARAAAFAGRATPMSATLGPACDALLPRLRAASDAHALDLLDAFFLARLKTTPADARVAQAHALLCDPDVRTVEDWSERLGIGARQLERICDRHFGLAPKRLLRRERLLRTLEEVRRVPPSAWLQAIGDAYADQSHFIREFRWFMYMTPGAWLRHERGLDRRVSHREALADVGSVQSDPGAAG